MDVVDFIELTLSNWQWCAAYILILATGMSWAVWSHSGKELGISAVTT